MLYELGDGYMMFISAKREQHGTNSEVADGFGHTIRDHSNGVSHHAWRNDVHHRWTYHEVLPGVMGHPLDYTFAVLNLH